MADLQRTIRAGLRLDEEGDAQLFGRTADEIEKMQDAAGAFNTAADSLATKSERAFRSVAEGSVRSASDVVKARVAIEAYKEALEDAERAGLKIGDGPRAQLALLEKDLDAAAAAAGRLAAAEQEAKRSAEDATEAAGAQVERISSLDDIVRKVTEGLGPGAVKWTSWGVAAAGALTAGYAAGTKLLGVLDQLTDGQISRNIQEVFVRQLRQLGIELEDTGDNADLLRNRMNILRNSGIDPTRLSTEEIAEAVNRLGQEMQQASFEASRGAAKIKEFVESLPTRAEATAAGDALGVAITKFQALNQLPLPKLRALFGAEITGVLNDLDRLGAETPAHLQAWVQALNILPTSLDAIRDQVKARIAALAKEFGAPEVRLPIEQQVAEINAALEGLGEIKGEARERVKKRVQDIVDQVREGKKQLSPELQELTDRFGIVTAASERAGDRIHFFSKGLGEVPPMLQRELSPALQALAGGLNDTATQSTKAAEAAKGLGEDAKVSAAKVTTAADEVGKAGDSIKTTGDKARDAAVEIKKPAEAVATSTTALQALAESMRQIDAGSAAAASGTESVGKAAHGVEQRARTAAEAMAAIGSVNFATPLIGQLHSIGAALEDLRLKAEAVITGIQVGLGGGS